VPPERILLGEGPAWEGAVARAAAVLSGGGIAVLATEGIYGYHARADREDALARLSALKPREAGRGWILLIAEPGELPRWASDPPPRALSLVRAHWPGALTLVLPGAAAVPALARAEDGTVALRCPGSAFLRAVLRALGAPLVSTSANAPGALAPSAAADVAPGGVELIVDAGRLSGIPSTLVRVVGDEVRLLRQGAVRVAAGRS
jgi:tRNA threonylcarbamoyl adenosine modification protein (Sua5/YciO/YrdC/YwlC family)